MLKDLTDRHSVSVSPIEVYLENLLRNVVEFRDGAVADYIPELAKADPENFAIVLATVDGAVYTVGNADVAITIQSISKPFMFGYALQEYGLDTVLKKVGVEPTGDPFNSIILDDAHNRPFNPMVNAGAIAMSELLRGETQAQKSAAQIDFFSRFAGRDLQIDDLVYQSESDTGHRNRAIAYMMLNSGMIAGPAEEVLDLYFRQCSILVTTRDLAVMASTLAAHGRNPLTGDRVMAPGNVRNVLSVMATCGMYDYAGQWMFDVGLPAKSGVSGGIIAVLPGQFGLAVYSPRLDSVGNSVRGIEVCKRFAREFGLHAYVDRSDTRSILRRMYRGNEVCSNRVRSYREKDVLQQEGRHVAVVEAQGPLYFGTVEQLIRRTTEFAEGCNAIILDFRRVAYIDHAARLLLLQFVQEMANEGIRISFVEVATNPNLAGFEEALLAETKLAHCAFITDIDHALEAEEDIILAKHGLRSADAKLSLSQLDLFNGLGREEISLLETAILTFEFDAGQTILRAGEKAQLIFVVVRGSVSIHLGEGSVESRRIAAVGPGQSFGEMALLDGGLRSAHAVADTPVLAYGFAVEEVRRLAKDRPKILEAMLGNIVRSLSSRLRAANAQIAALE